MRAKIITALLMAGTVVGCASNPPPPPPMAMTPPPPAPVAAPPAAMGSSDGMYRGMAELAADAPARCAKMTRTQSVRVRRGAFTLMGMRGMVGPDGAITSTTRRNMSLAGTASGTTLDVTAMKGTCSYHYTLNKA